MIVERTVEACIWYALMDCSYQPKNVYEPGTLTAPDRPLEAKVRPIPKFPLEAPGDLWLRGQGDEPCALDAVGRSWALRAYRAPKIFFANGSTADIFLPDLVAFS